MMDTPQGPATLPLCVDLDGTLLRSDLLLESALALLARQPWMVFALPWWLLRGKAHLKREIARRVQLDPTHLPYDERVLAHLRAHQDRHRVLCTASDESLARAVAGHLGCFDEVMASDGQRNLSGGNKAVAFIIFAAAFIIACVAALCLPERKGLDLED